MSFYKSKAKYPMLSFKDTMNSSASQLLNYLVGLSCEKRYKSLLWFVIDASICYAFILLIQNHFRTRSRRTKLKQADFGTRLSKKLIVGLSSTVSSVQTSEAGDTTGDYIR